MFKNFPEDTKFTQSTKGFKIDYFINSQVLCIEAEHQGLSKFFKKRLSNEDVLKITNNFVGTAKELHEVIKYAVTNKDDDTTVVVTDDAEIVVCQRTRVGPNERKLQFWIKLEEVFLTPLQMCQKYIEEIEENNGKGLSVIDGQFLKAFKKVIEDNQNKEKKLNDALSRIEALEASLQ